MDQLVVKCRCRGTNGECHLCFGTGDVLAHGDEMFYAAPVAPRADKGKPPSKQPHRSAESNGIEAAFLRHAGLGQRASAQALIDAMRLCEKRGQPQVKEVLRQSLRCARPQFSSFVAALAAAMRRQGTTVVTALVDINGFLIHGKCPARINTEHVSLLASAWIAQASTNKDEGKLAARIAAAGSNGPRPPMSAGPKVNQKQPTTAFGALAPAKQNGSKSAGIEHVLVVSAGNIRSERVEQLSRFVAKHAFARLYLGGPKKAHSRHLAKEYPAIDIVHVENPANLAFIRTGRRVAVFDLDAAMR
ncbi:hypothetical protein [Ensifer sp. 22564]|uniref:hypothetical protein n=1 Tax=Ensifer sp. 22564 TaxID=3453943 RepID=UPI003F82942F